MATDRYDPLKIPNLHDYPFISGVFSCKIFGFTNAQGQSVNLDATRIQRLKDTVFKSPGHVKEKQLAPMKAMTNQTFESFFGLLKPSINSKSIRSKADLESLSAIEHSHHTLNDEPFTLDQMASYLLFGAKLSPNIQWAKVAKLINECEPDQKEAIHKYVEEYKNCNLRWPFRLNPKIIELPESLQERFESKVQDCDTYLYSESLQKWLRDDRFHHQYQVEFMTKIGFKRTLAATAPTLSQAIAKASVFVLEGGYEYEFSHCRIRQNGLPVADANVLLRNREDDKLIDRAKCPKKLIWQTEHLGFKQDYIKNVIIRDGGATQSQVNSMLKNYTPITEKAFIKTLYAVEKALGLQWNKVARLEDALGL